MAKKIKKNKASGAEPMPSLIFHEAPLDEKNSGTPNADQIEKELLSSGNPPTLEHLSGYKKSSHRLMWGAVIFLTCIVCTMWAWSIYSRISLVNWSVTKDKSFADATLDNWNRAFSSTASEAQNTDRKLSEIKENLSKLFAGETGSKFASGTPGISTTTR